MSPRGQTGRGRRLLPLVPWVLLAFLLGPAGVLARVPPVAASTPTAATPGPYLSTSDALQLQGAWRRPKDPYAPGGSYLSLAAPGQVRVTFRGNGVRWSARTGVGGGLADVYVDGRKRARIDLYSAKAVHNRVVYTARGLADGLHTITVVRTGEKNPASQGRNLDVVSFFVTDSHPPAALPKPVATPSGTGARVTWAPSSATDLAGYQLYRRRTGGFGKVADLSRTEHAFTDVGLAAAATYAYRAVAVDTSGNLSPQSTDVAVTTAAAPPTHPYRYATCPAATTAVSTAAQLRSALAAAAPGSVIRLAPGTYRGDFTLHAQGTAEAPIWLCGPRDAVLTRASWSVHAGLSVHASAHVVAAGFTVRDAPKGVVVSASHHITVADLRIEQLDEEAVHLLGFTTDSTVIANSVERTGRVNPGYGEGVYVGTATSNVCRFSGCRSDRSDRNTVTQNTFRQVTAEAVEVKPGANRGTVTDNTMDGSAMQGITNGLITVRGNGWVVAHNTGHNSLRDGVTVIRATRGWGQHNVVYGNRFTGAVPGFGVRFPADAPGNVAGCDNVAPSRSRGLSNDPCQL